MRLWKTFNSKRARGISINNFLTQINQIISSSVFDLNQKYKNLNTQGYIHIGK